MSPPRHDAAERHDRGPRHQQLVSEESVILDITEALVEGMNDALDITEALVEGMNDAGMTREELAARAGVHPGALQRELEGAARIPLRDLIRIAAAVGLKPKLVRHSRPTRP